MGWYSKGVDALRARTKADVGKFNIIEKLLKEGTNPVGFVEYSSVGTSIIRVEDVFAYYQAYDKQFDAIIGGI